MDRQPFKCLVAILVLYLVTICFASASRAQSITTTTPSPAACAGFSGTGIRFDLAGFCARLSGSLSFTFQDDLSTTGSGAPSRLTSAGKRSFQRYTKTYETSSTLGVKRMTPLGVLDGSITGEWLKTSDDGTDAGDASIQEVYASLAGGTVGYTSSLMNFWSEDFEFLAAAPSRTAGIVSYEHRIMQDTKAAIAIESGLPTAKQNTDGLDSISFNSPLLTGRVLYENSDGWAAQWSGLLRQAKTQTNPIIAAKPSTVSSRLGWATTVGATAPTKFIDAKDYVSGQAVYAVDASAFLGTAVDLSSLAASVPNTGPTDGWSAVASFHHQWAKDWETNLFASYLALDIDLLNAKPTVRTKSYGINLYWTAIDTLRLGAELGRVETTIKPNGTFGFLNGASGKAWVGYLDAKWTF